MISVSFSICSFIYIIIFSVVYFSKTRINLIENKVYTLLLITTIVGLSIDIMGYFSFKNGDINSPINIGIAKVYLIYYFTWIYLLTIYTYLVSIKSKKEKNYDKIIKTFLIIYLFFVSIIPLLKVNIKNTGATLYSYGPSVNLIYALSALCMIFMILIIILNIKKIRKREYIPLFVFIIFGTVSIIIQHNYPDILLLITCQSIITALMYFTIENPDMKMVEELSKNRKLTEQTFEEKSNFLFKISQDLKKPLIDIEKISNNIIENPKEDIKEQAKTINNISKQLYTYVNSALDISNIDIKNLKIINNTYSTDKLFEEIKLRIKNELEKNNKKIEFRYELSKTVPKYLIGDNTKIKQSILSIIFDSIIHTEKGFIELNINSISKYGVCRLIFEISDSGSGMELDKINNILGNIGNLTPEELEKIDKLNISLPLAHKIIKSINGNLIIKSEVNKGTSFIIIIDQKIKEQEKNIELDKYSKKLTSNSDLMLISTDKKIKDEIINKLENKEITITNSLYGKDCINRIKDGEKYKLIIIDENLKEESALDILKELRQNDIKIPTIIMIEKRNEFLKEHYLEDGFTNIIIKEKIDNDINIINKYL